MSKVQQGDISVWLVVFLSVLLYFALYLLERVENQTKTKNLSACILVVVLFFNLKWQQKKKKYSGQFLILL